ncbi:MAG TPA: hypothetical protein VKR06_05825 [Ktedonosporobacter sp.]|nr:hypothetical protein [Ktedonosporobacter sp.]
MRIMNTTIQKKWICFVGFLLTGALILTACGANFTTTGSTSGTPATGTASTPSPTLTTIQTVKGYGAPYGCPSDAVVSAASTAASVTVRPGQGHTTFSVQPGNVLEVQMPFGIAWRGPDVSGEGLQLQSPAGYVSKANNACIWLYTAKNAGTEKLTFVGSILCKQNLHCALAEVINEFTIKVG